MTQILCLLTLITLSVATLTGQTHDVGVQLTGLHLHKVDEAPFGVGVRFHYYLFSLTAADMEFTHSPEDSSGNFGETTALLGVRAGKRFDRVGVFAKARPGVIHFGGEYFRQRLDQKTHLIFDIGWVLEYYPGLHTFLRIDAGDTVIYYGSARLFNRLNPDALGTVHNFQPGFGFGFRF